MSEVPERGWGSPFEGIWATASWPLEGLSLQITPESWHVSGLAVGLELGNNALRKSSQEGNAQMQHDSGGWSTYF